MSKKWCKSDMENKFFKRIFSKFEITNISKIKRIKIKIIFFLHFIQPKCINGNLTTKLINKRVDFNFSIVNFSYLGCNVHVPSLHVPA